MLSWLPIWTTNSRHHHRLRHFQLSLFCLLLSLPLPLTHCIPGTSLLTTLLITPLLLYSIFGCNPVFLIMLLDYYAHNDHAIGIVVRSLSPRVFPSALLTLLLKFATFANPGALITDWFEIRSKSPIEAARCLGFQLQLWDFGTDWVMNWWSFVCFQV